MLFTRRDPRFLVSSILLLVTTLVGCADAKDGATEATTAADTTGGLSRDAALARLKGPFDGDWTLYGVDPNGASRTISHWTDTVTASAPTDDGAKLFIVATDSMTFDGSSHPIQQTWKEGYFLNADGSIGDRYIDQNGQITIEKEALPNTFTIVETATIPDLKQLGFTNPSSGTHVTVKVVTTAGSIDTERISRVSTVSWKDATGADRVTQMVTLQGQHQHVVAD